MSSLVAKLSSAAGRSPRTSPRSSIDLDSSVRQEADKYRLLVTAGPSYDPSTHQVVHVNTDTPTYIENEFLRAKLKVRIQGFRGLPSLSPKSSPYFEDAAHLKDQYSISFSFVPKQDLPSLHTIWGNDFDHPVRDRLPPGFNTAFRIVKEFIDPGLECDAYADEPWLYGPSLSCWFAFNIGDEIGQEKDIPEAPERQDIVREGAEGSGQPIRAQLGLSDNNEKRRKFFLSADRRSPFTFEKDRLYKVDFYNPYLDFGNFALKLPGFSIKVIKYINEKSHTLRYVFKNRKTEEVYLCVNLNLLWGEQLQRALKDDEEQILAFAGGEAEVNGVKIAGGEDQEDEWHDAEDMPDAAAEHSHGPSIDAKKEDAGLKDKPDALREQIDNMNLKDTLRETASEDRQGGAGGILDDLD